MEADAERLAVMEMGFEKSYRCTFCHWRCKIDAFTKMCLYYPGIPMWFSIPTGILQHFFASLRESYKLDFHSCGIPVILLSMQLSNRKLLPPMALKYAYCCIPFSHGPSILVKKIYSRLTLVNSHPSAVLHCSLSMSMSIYIEHHHKNNAANVQSIVQRGTSSVCDESSQFARLINRVLH